MLDANSNVWPFRYQASIPFICLPGKNQVPRVSDSQEKSKGEGVLVCVSWYIDAMQAYLPELPQTQVSYYIPLHPGVIFIYW